MEDHSEYTLIEALRRGDDAAYERLVRENTARMLIVARRILRNESDASDAVQEAFMQAFRAIDRFEGEAKLSTWLHRITVNACLLRLRRAKRHPEVAIEELLPRFDETGHRVAPDGEGFGEDAFAELEREQVGMLVRDAIEQLPRNFRDVVVLRDIEGLSTEETAQVLGIRPEAAKMRLHRARQALRTLLEPQMRSGAMA